MIDLPDFSANHVAAWRCEECRNWISPKILPTALFVSEIGEDVEEVDPLQPAMHARIERVMIVCVGCYYDMTHGGLSS